MKALVSSAFNAASDLNSIAAKVAHKTIAGQDSNLRPSGYEFYRQVYAQINVACSSQTRPLRSPQFCSNWYANWYATRMVRNPARCRSPSLETTHPTSTRYAARAARRRVASKLAWSEGSSIASRSEIDRSHPISLMVIPARAARGSPRRLRSVTRSWR